MIEKAYFRVVKSFHARLLRKRLNKRVSINLLNKFDDNLRVRRRKHRQRDANGLLIFKDYTKSLWWQMLQDPEIEDPASESGRKFRRRFRVPYPIFVRIVEMAEIVGFELRPINQVTREPGVPLELKVLGILVPVYYIQYKLLTCYLYMYI
jgi:hypothetical protein